jgi:tRNA nucleotidyltransferase (CCA-adding enzyme)
VDFDALASMVAAKKLYPEAVMVFAGSVNRNVHEFITLHADVLEFMEQRAIDKEAINRLIVVDNRIAGRLGEFGDLPERPDVQVFVYDHHPKSRHDMKNIQDYSEETGATTTILVKIIRGKGIPVNPFEATLFILGIYEDTGSLTFPGTTFEDAEAVAYLMRERADLSVVNHFLGQQLSAEQHELMRKLLSGLEQRRVRGVLVNIAKAETDGFVEGGSLVASKLMELENLDVLFAVIRMARRVVIVGLSRLRQVDVDEILSGLDGGGHPKAGSAVLRGVTLKTAEKKLLDMLERRVGPLVTAGDVMSGPVRTLTEETPIAEASKRMELTGHTAFPVVDQEGRLAGMISRKDLDKAAHHGLGHAPVKGFMTREVVTAEPETSLQEIQDMMIRNAIGRVPVLRDGLLLGIVTRKDIIRALHGQEYLGGFSPEGGTPTYSRAEIIERIQEKMPSDVQALLRVVSRTAAQNAYSVFLVGGVVRDLLLGFSNLDLDIVVEGDGIEFAQLIARELSGRVRSHRKFGTAVVILPTGRRIDVASARTEFYEYPAALPTVEMSSIRQDLYRRDFTINAMAFNLSGEHFGELLDYFGGVRDLERRHVRILHNLSFVEDPTRIFRAVRFEVRYGFVMESQTEMLARRAVEMEIVGKLTNSRVRDELIDIFLEQEPLPFQAIERLEDLHALQTLHPDLAVTPEMRRRFLLLKKHIARAWELLGPGSKHWLPGMAALLSDLPSNEVEKWCNQMRFKREDRETIMQCHDRVPDTLALLSSQKIPPSQVVSQLDPLNKEALAYLYALGGSRVQELTQAYLGRWKNVTVEIGGEDLAGMGLRPSPAYGEILHRVRAELLDGKLKNREDQLALAAELIKQRQQG